MNIFSKLNKIIIIIIKKLKILSLSLLLLLLNTTNLTALNLQNSPISQYSPLNPVVHIQRYPLSVKPVWQVALFSQRLFTHLFWDRKIHGFPRGNWNSCFTSNCFTENHESQIAYNCKLRLVRWSSLHFFFIPQFKFMYMKLVNSVIIFNNLFPFA